MLERFATVMYLIFFAIGFAIFVGFVGLGYNYYSSYGNLINLIKASVVGIVCFAFSFFIGWSIRYIITGKKSIT
jgi:hypothetical protein